jgi:hypothetical protein
VLSLQLAVSGVVVWVYALCDLYVLYVGKLITHKFTHSKIATDVR